METRIGQARRKTSRREPGTGAAIGGAHYTCAHPMAGSGTLIVDTSFLGDVLCAEPLVRAAARVLPGEPVDFLAAPGAAALLQGHPQLRAVLTFDKRGADRGLGGLLRAARRLRAAGYARAWCTHRSWRTALLLRLAGIPERAGYANASGSWLYTRRVPYRAEAHEIERNLDFAGGGAWERPRIFPNAADRAAAAELAPAAPFVAVAPGSLWATKRWPEERFTELARALAADGVRLALLGGPEDRALCARIAAAAGGARVADLAGRTNLRASFAVLERAACLVTNDSAPMHLGVAAGVPVVALYCSTVPRFGFGPRGARDVALGVDGLDCRPCGIHGHRACPLGHFRCGQDLPAARVLAEVRSRIPLSIA